MGEATKGPLRLDFDRRLKLEFRGATITSDAGLLAFRELDDALGLSRRAGQKLADGRLGKNIQHQIVTLFRQAVFGRLAGYEDVNDAERLRLDPAKRALVGHRDALRFAASTSADPAAAGAETRRADRASRARAYLRGGAAGQLARG